MSSGDGTTDSSCTEVIFPRMSLSVNTYNLKADQAEKAEIGCKWLNCEIPRRPWNILIILTHTSSVGSYLKVTGTYVSIRTIGRYICWLLMCGPEIVGLYPHCEGQCCSRQSKTVRIVCLLIVSGSDRHLRAINAKYSRFVTAH
jgi:hypothetical protein